MAVICTNGIVVSVVVVRIRRVADTEPATNDRVVCDSIGEPGAWREVPISCLHAQIGWIAAIACYNDVVVDIVIVGEAAGSRWRRATGSLRCSGWIELPPDTKVDRQLRCGLPLISGIGEE